VFVGVLY
ncbi:putative tight adherence TadB-like transmembrane domain protein, partial [Vibrio parahaemolyticus V-223/04]